MDKMLGVEASRLGITVSLYAAAPFHETVELMSSITSGVRMTNLTSHFFCH